MELTLEMLTDHLQKHGIDVHLVQRRLKKRAFRDVRRAPAAVSYTHLDVYKRQILLSIVLEKGTQKMVAGSKRKAAAAA